MRAGRAQRDKELEIIFGNLLRAGVVLSAVVVLAGGVLYLIRHGSATPHYSLFRGEPADLRSVKGIVQALAGFNPRAVIQFGLLLLIATPIARVCFAVFAFLWERDFLYVAIASIVLGILIFSLTGVPF